MFKFMLGVLFAVALMHPQAAKDFLVAAVDVVHNTSTVAVSEGSKLAEEQSKALAARAAETTQ